MLSTQQPISMQPKKKKIDTSKLPFAKFVLDEYSEEVYTVIKWHDERKGQMLVKKQNGNIVVMEVTSRIFQLYTKLKIIER